MKRWWLALIALIGLAAVARALPQYTPVLSLDLPKCIIFYPYGWDSGICTVNGTPSPIAVANATPEPTLGPGYFSLDCSALVPGDRVSVDLCGATLTPTITLTPTLTKTPTTTPTLTPTPTPTPSPLPTNACCAYPTVLGGICYSNSTACDIANGGVIHLDSSCIISQLPHKGACATNTPTPTPSDTNDCCQQTTTAPFGAVYSTCVSPTSNACPTDPWTTSVVVHGASCIDGTTCTLFTPTATGTRTPTPTPTVTNTGTATSVGTATNTPTATPTSTFNPVTDCCDCSAFPTPGLGACDTIGATCPTPCVPIHHASCS